MQNGKFIALEIRIQQNRLFWDWKFSGSIHASVTMTMLMWGGDDGPRITPHLMNYALKLSGLGLHGSVGMYKANRLNWTAVYQCSAVQFIWVV